jgi:hypothetical protein
MHLDFMVSIYIEQIEGGRQLFHEHPANATSWHEASVERLAKFPGVELVHADQCHYGVEVMFGQYKGQPIKKPTGFMSNGSRVLKALTQRYDAAVVADNARGRRAASTRYALARSPRTRRVIRLASLKPLSEAYVTSSTFEVS